MTRRHSWLFLLSLGSIAVSLFGCGADTTSGPPPVSPTHAYWALQLNQHAVNLALNVPYETVHLLAIPVNAAGAPLSGLGTVVYTTPDSTVTVDTSGIVTAHFVTLSGPTIVVATLQDQIQSVTHSDTVYIQVNQTVPQLPFRTFSLQASPGDSAKRSFDTQQWAWPVTAIDGQGNPLCSVQSCSLQVSYSSSNPNVATINPQTGTVTAKDTGRVTLTATTLAYGTRLRDSVRFIVGYAIYPAFVMTFDSVKKRVAFGLGRVGGPYGVGAVVTFLNWSDEPTDIVFDNPAAADSVGCTILGTTLGPASGSGNILMFGGDKNHSVFNTFNCRSRRISIPGTYRMYSSQVPSDSLEIIIQHEVSP